MVKSIRPFIGAKDFDESVDFYQELGFLEIKVSRNMSYFKVDDKFGFYLQRAFVKDWVDNSMLFLEVENIENYLAGMKSKNIFTKFPKSKLSEIIVHDWGKEFFLHDPSGILWHIGNFKA
jgi:catechol 2,3-dioxygenase-like lactoylglutathione lyase family enzyme